MKGDARFFEGPTITEEELFGTPSLCPFLSPPLFSKDFAIVDIPVNELTREKLEDIVNIFRSRGKSRHGTPKIKGKFKGSEIIGLSSASSTSSAKGEKKRKVKLYVSSMSSSRSSVSMPISSANSMASSMEMSSFTNNANSSANSSSFSSSASTSEVTFEVDGGITTLFSAQSNVGHHDF